MSSSHKDQFDQLGRLLGLSAEAPTPTSAMVPAGKYAVAPQLPHHIGAPSGALEREKRADKQPCQAYLPNIADSEVLNEVSQIVLKIDFVFVIGTTLFQFSLKITPDSRFVLLGLISGVLSLLSML